MQKFLIDPRPKKTKRCSNARNELYALAVSWKRFLFVAAALCICQMVYGQEVSVKIKNGTLTQAFKSIEKQTDFDFWYYKKELIYAKPVNMSMQDEPLEDVLNKLFDNQPFHYRIVDKTIVIFLRQPKKQGEPDDLADSGQPTTRTITGVAYDVDSSPLKGAVVKVVGFDKSATTNDGGAFIIDVPTAATTLEVSCHGYDNTLVTLGNEQTLKVQLDRVPITLANAEVSVELNKVDPTRFLSLKNRNYMNLGQALQGTIPGLTLQVINSTSSEVIAVERFEFRSGTNMSPQYVRMSLDEFYNYVGQVEGQRIIDALQSGQKLSSGGTEPYRLITAVRNRATLAPQVRGANSYTGNLSNVLIVIDGFPQEEFQADFPMTNVESIEVIKDPKELVKWGPKANGGVILIRTKTPKRGHVSFNYTTNMYFTPAPKFTWERFLLSSSADYVDFLKEYFDTFSPSWEPNSTNLTPAQELYMLHHSKLISDEQYERGWDSLARTNNDDQLALMQQDAFSQNHTLNMDGGTRNYRFNFTGSYFRNMTNELRSLAQSGSLSLRNNFRLLDDKITINWLIDYMNGNNRSGYNLNPNITLEPYQLLVDNNDRYIYNNRIITASMNDRIMQYGYLNHGENILEDTRLNDVIARDNQKQSRFDFNYDILPELQFKTTVYFQDKSTITERIYDRNSTYARQLYNSYAEYSTDGLINYVPHGEILNYAKQNYKELNFRSGISFAKEIGKHGITATLGTGAASTERYRPSFANTFGYNAANKTGSPIFLPAGNPNGPISNYNEILRSTTSSAYPYTLLNKSTGDSTINRNVNWNASFQYNFNRKYFISAMTNNVFTPVYAQKKKYSNLTTYNLTATANVYADPFKTVSLLALSSGIQHMKMPDLPISYNNIRYLQGSWGNNAIWVRSISPIQQKGQQTRNYAQKATIGFWRDQLKIDAAFNIRHMSGRMTSFVATNTDTAGDSTLYFMSGSMQGQFRNNLLNFNVNYDKSPEGTSQWNGTFNYDISQEPFFHSKAVSMLRIDGRYQQISAFQGLNIMMGTNTMGSNGYSLSTNSDFSVLPPDNTNWEVHLALGLRDNRNVIDLRYYNTTTAGINNFVPSYTDPATGLDSRTTFSSIINKGLEFFFQNAIVKKEKFEYNFTINGAYNINIARNVPKIAFGTSNNFISSYREGYDISGLWSYEWAGLNNEGDPQIYDAAGRITAVLDSTTLASSLVYSGPSKAPWTGGIIQDISWGNVFARAAINFSLNYHVRRYTPAMNSTSGGERSMFVRDRWREPGDEAKTDIPALSSQDPNGFRSFVIRNASNNLIAGDHLRVQEVMVGWASPSLPSNRLGIKRFTASVQAQNIAIWTKNKDNIDPTTVSGNGLSFPIPRQYSFTLNIGF